MRYAARIIVVGTLVCAPTLLGQDVSGRIEGTAVRSDGSPVPGAEVAVTGPSLQGTRTVPADAAGTFRVLALPVGRYVVRIRAVGLRPVQVEDVRVELGKATVLGPIVLDGVVTLDPVVVTAERAPVDVTTAAVGTNLSAEDFRDVPSERDYQDLLKLLPQTTESFTGDPINIGGATGLENFFYIDGVNVTDPFVNGSSMRLPHNFIREVQVRTGGYEAEHSRALGGVVNVVTYSGSNAFSASAFGYFNNHALTSTEKLGLLDATSRGANVYDFGATIGGPVVRDRLWYFAAYDAGFENKDVEIPGLGFYGDRRTEHLFAGKLTWRAGTHTNLVLSLLGDPTTHDRVGGGPFTLPDSLLEPGPFLNRIETGGVSVALSGTHVLGTRALLEGSVSYVRRKLYDGPRAGDDEPRHVLITGQGEELMSGGFGERIDERLTRFSGRLISSVFLGAHTVKIGAEYEDYGTHDRVGNSGPGVILDFGSPAASFCGVQWCVIFAEGDAVLRGRVPSLYVQDSWQILERLRLTGGLRWDGQYLLDNHGRVAQSMTAQWQPRFGAVYQLGRLGTQKLTASLGRFYEMMPLRLSTQNYNDGRINGIERWNTDPRLPGQALDTLVVFCCGIKPALDGMAGTHIDEATLGYEGVIHRHVKLGVRGVYRTLRDVVLRGNTNLGESFIGNPGQAPLDFLDPARRQYLALELTAALLAWDGLDLSASYVLSRVSGNFPGLYDSDARLFFPHESSIFERAEQMQNNEGVLPNDRTHVVKLYGSYTFGFGLVLGTFVTAQTGTPLSQYEEIDLAFRRAFLTPRGTEGRLPALWDISLRGAYPVMFSRRSGLQARVVVDLLHLGNPQRAVLQEQVARLVGGGPNAAYGQVARYQPAMTLRVGAEIGF